VGLEVLELDIRSLSEKGEVVDMIASGSVHITGRTKGKSIREAKTFKGPY
jgi:hypothetical protein